MSNQSSLNQLNEGKQRLDTLVSRSNRLQGQMEAARIQYEAACAEAQAECGTSDLNQLRTKLAELEKENQIAADQFTAALDKFESVVAMLEDAMSNPEAMVALQPRIEAALASMVPAEPAAAPETTSPAATVAFAEEDI